ncbi:MAG TPA: TMEM175 family protein [Asanoa sp.]|nr:TMEM175 family protein [Asanoa sp.]
MSETRRTEAFSDGVLAIAITLLVLDLRVPVRDALEGSLADALGHEWPTYAAYVTSFLVIGIIWVNHHAVFELLGAIDRVALFLNLLLLMTVAAIPFATSLFAEYLTAGGAAARTAALVYSGLFLVMSLAFGVLYGYAGYHPALLAPGVDPVAVRASIFWFSGVGLALYSLTMVIAVFSAPATLVAHLVIALYYCFRQTRTQKRPQASAAS